MKSRVLFEVQMKNGSLIASQERLEQWVQHFQEQFNWFKDPTELRWLLKDLCEVKLGSLSVVEVDQAFLKRQISWITCIVKGRMRFTTNISYGYYKPQKSEEVPVEWWTSVIIRVF